MKDYTEYKYIEPIIKEIKSIYTAITEPDILNYFNTAFEKCKMILSFNNQYMPLYARADMPTFIKTPQSLKSLYQDVNEYSYYASTYEGELDNWSDREKNRILEAVKRELINHSY